MKSPGDQLRYLLASSLFLTMALIFCGNMVTRMHGQEVLCTRRQRRSHCTLPTCMSQAASRCKMSCRRPPTRYCLSLHVRRPADIPFPLQLHHVDQRVEKANQPGRFMLRPLLVALALQLASGFVLYTPATRSLELQHPRHAAVTSGFFDIFKESVGPLATHLRH